MLGVFRGVESNPGVLHSNYFNFIIMLTEEETKARREAVEETSGNGFNYRMLDDLVAPG